ncbi:1-phosphofructokinase family hexose kinase [Thioclava sp. GXIMD4216]|uniref:Phosphofructokinase n=1 Tax=Thioclava litoralis TaxID=3076557 RepID=A0ABZ1E2A5_9RHOB|nr:1-phosphofructokinase family hexose kinase [Thioclava sp. FTW29]
MTPILTVTLNPTVDLSIATAHVQSERKLRCTNPAEDPGGGGINVSRAIAAMGGQSTAFVALGGATGTKVAALLAAQGIGLVPFAAPGETRQSLTVTDESTGEQYRFVMPGPDWSAADVGQVLEQIARAMPESGIIVLSGSQPPGFPEDFPARLASLVAPHHARVFLDTSGPALRQLLDGRHQAADLLRMDDLEAEDLAGHPLPARTDTADFAQHLVAKGLAHAVLIARGAEGNVLATASHRWFATAPKVPVVSKVGAGDSFVAGFTLALSRGAPLPDALRYGAAAAAAAVMTPATELCRGTDVEALLDLEVSAL